MKSESTYQSQRQLVGLSIRTNNKNELNSTTSKIGLLITQYWQNNMSSKITQRKLPGTTISAYTNYESDEHGDYTYFIGEEVFSFNAVPESFTTIIIPSGQYQKFTTEPGKIPEIIINAWHSIWTMTESKLNGKRNYRTDFEVYDQRAADPTNAVLDIYIGIE